MFVKAHPNNVVPVVQSHKVSRMTVDKPLLIILTGAPRLGNWTPFNSNFISVSDERGSIINDDV